MWQHYDFTIKVCICSKCIYHMQLTHTNGSLGIIRVVCFMCLMLYNNKQHLSSGSVHVSKNTVVLHTVSKQSYKKNLHIMWYCLTVNKIYVGAKLK